MLASKVLYENTRTGNKAIAGGGGAQAGSYDLSIPRSINKEAINVK